MTKLTTQQRIQRWALSKRTVSVARARRELGYESKSGLMFYINRSKRRGMVKCEKKGSFLTFGLTKLSYLNRTGIESGAFTLAHHI